MALSLVVQDIPYDFQSAQCSVTASGPTGGPQQGTGGAATGIIGIITGIEDFEYTSKIQRAKLYGSSRTPRTRTRGDVEPDGSVTLWRSHFQAIRSFAKANGIALADLHMTWAITYTAQGYPPYTDTLYDVLIGEIGQSGQRGPDALMTKIPLDILNIFYDGEDVFGNKL